MLKNKKPEREYYMDWIKVIVVLLIVPFHTAVSFSHIGRAYVYSKEASDSFLYFFLSDFLNLWFMRMLFFISGITAYVGLRKRTTREYLKERFQRLIIPVIFNLLTIGPLSAYIMAKSQYAYSGTFLSFYPKFFLYVKKYLFWGHMWFCIYLFAFSLICIPLFSFLKRKTHIIRGINSYLLRGNNLLLPMLIIIAFEMIFRPFYPGMQSLIGDWANFSVHLSFFIFGFIMGQSKELFNLIIIKLRMFLTLGILSTGMYIFIKRYAGFSVDDYNIKLILSMYWGIAAYSWIMFFIAFFRKNLNKYNKLLKDLSNSSFSLYMFHYYIITLFNYYFLKTEINHYLIWCITSIFTYIAFILLFKIVLKRINFFRFICGIKV